MPRNTGSSSSSPQYDPPPSFGKVLREEATEVGVAAVRRVAESLKTRIVFQEGLNLVATIPTEKGWLGGRLVVPPDEVHIVTGDGPTTWKLNNGYKIFGQPYVEALKKQGKPTAGVQTVYWRNARTVIRALKTTAFTVTLENQKVLDNGYVAYFADVHMIAELDVADPFLAASKIGSMEELLGNIEQVAASELTTAAAKFALVEVIKDRSVLGTVTEAGVKTALKAIGYTLNTLRIGELRGEAVEKLVQQSTAVVTKDATIKINEAELVTLGDNRARERREAELRGKTDTEVTASRLTAERANESAGLDKEEAVASRSHALDLANTARRQETAEAANRLNLRQIGLDQSEKLIRTQSDAATALEAQRLAKERELSGATDDARRLDLVQSRDLTRQADKADKDAARLMQEAAAQADRAKVVQTTEAEAAADALGIKTKAETGARLLVATTTAQAAEKNAEADIKLAAATRARDAATGLAAADVRERDLANDEKAVVVKRAAGLADAEVAEKTADASIHLQKGIAQVELDRLDRLAALLAAHPEMLALETLKLEQAHAMAMHKAGLDAQVEIAKALAPNMQVNLQLIGDGGQVSRGMAQFMAIAKGLEVVGNQVPLVGNLIGSHGSSDGDLMSMLQKLAPTAKKWLAGLAPTALTSMKVSDLVNELGPVVAGDKTLAEGLQKLKAHANFRMFANWDLSQILPFLGMGSGSDTATEVAAANPAA